MAYSDFTLEMACMSLALDLNEETEHFAGIIKSGLGQCVAGMVGARVLSERHNEKPTFIHGAVTAGMLWRFLKLDGCALMIDRTEYSVEPVGMILAILLHCIGGNPAKAGAAA